MREEGVVPAVAYGPGLKTTQALSVSARDVVKALNQPAGKNTAVTLLLGDEAHLALIREVQVHPLSRRLLHVDFLATHPEHTVVAIVPLEVVGKSKGEEAGGAKYQPVREIKVKCFPQSIPEKLVIDATPLETNSVVYVDGITYPEGVTPIFKTRFPVLVIEKSRDEEKAAAKEE